MMIDKKYEQVCFDFDLSNKLTFDEQQEMIEQNLKLIYKVINNMGYNSKSEDLYDVGLIGLIKGVRNFDKTKKIKPSTFLYPCIKNEIINQLCYEKKDVLSRSIPMSQILDMNQEPLNEKMDQQMFFKDSCDLENDVFIKVTFDKISEILDKEKPIYKEIFCKYYGIGCLQESPEDIVENYGFTYTSIRVILCRIRKKLRKEINDWNEE